MRDARRHAVLRLVLVAAFLFATLPLTGCDRWFDEDIFDMIHEYLEDAEEAARIGDITDHVGGMGEIIGGG